MTDPNVLRRSRWCAKWRAGCIQVAHWAARIGLAGFVLLMLSMVGSCDSPSTDRAKLMGYVVPTDAVILSGMRLVRQPMGDSTLYCAFPVFKTGETGIGTQDHPVCDAAYASLKLLGWQKNLYHEQQDIADSICTSFHLTGVGSFFPDDPFNCGYPVTDSTLPPPPPPVTVAFTQSAGSESDNAVSSISRAWSAAVGAGNTLVAVVSWQNKADVLTRVSDACGQTWTRVPGSLSIDSSYIQGAAVYYLPNTKSGACTVTASFSTASGYASLGLAEYRGTLGIDKAVAGKGATTTLAKSPTLTPTGSGRLLFGYTFDIGPSNTTVTAGTNVAWVKRLDWGHTGLAAGVEDLVQGTAAPVDAEFRFGTGSPYLAGLVAFRPPAGTAPTMLQYRAPERGFVPLDTTRKVRTDPRHVTPLRISMK